MPARLVWALALPIALVLAAAAGASWSAQGSGAGGGRALTMPAGARPSVTVSGTDVTVRWPAATFPGGTAVEGYAVRRFDANGSPQPVAAECAGLVGTTTCTEHNVPAGSWTYTDTPAQGSWRGAESPPGGPAAVG